MKGDFDPLKDVKEGGNMVKSKIFLKILIKCGSLLEL
jgi:hypothetical protein